MDRLEQIVDRRFIPISAGRNILMERCRSAQNGSDRFEGLRRVLGSENRGIACIAIGEREGIIEPLLLIINKKGQQHGRKDRHRGDDLPTRGIGLWPQPAVARVSDQFVHCPTCAILMKIGRQGFDSDQCVTGAPRGRSLRRVAAGASAVEIFSRRRMRRPYAYIFISWASSALKASSTLAPLGVRLTQLS